MQDGFAEDASEIKPNGTGSFKASRLQIYERKSSTGRESAEEDLGLTCRGLPDPRNDLINISLPLVRAACADVVHIIPDAFASWSTLRNAGPALRRLSSINPQVFNEAQNQLGPDLAITALAITVEHTARGSVLNPGAYLRSLLQRGQNGNLHLSRSLFALADKYDEQRTQRRRKSETLDDAPALLLSVARGKDVSVPMLPMPFSNP